MLHRARAAAVMTLCAMLAAWTTTAGPALACDAAEADHHVSSARYNAFAGEAGVAMREAELASLGYEECAKQAKGVQRYEFMLRQGTALYDAATFARGMSLRDQVRAYAGKAQTVFDRLQYDAAVPAAIRRQAAAKAKALPSPNSPDLDIQ